MKRWKKGTGKMFEKATAENFSNLVKVVSLQIQKVTGPKTVYIQSKLHFSQNKIIKEKEKSESREKAYIRTRNSNFKATYFLSETMKVKTVELIMIVEHPEG